MGDDQPAGRVQRGGWHLANWPARRRRARNYRPALVARVLPDVAGFDRELDYVVPARLAGDIRPGCIVRVPLQGRRVRGWVIAYPVEPPEGIALRPVAKVTGWGPRPGWWSLRPGRRGAGRGAPVLPGHRLTEVRRPTASGPSRPRCHGVAGSRRSSRPLPVAPATATTTGAVGGAGGDRTTLANGPGSRQRSTPAGHPRTPATAGVQRNRGRPGRGRARPRARRRAYESEGRGRVALRRVGIDVALLPGEVERPAQAQRSSLAAGPACAPCPGLASLVVLEAHDEALVQEQSPTWDAPRGG